MRDNGYLKRWILPEQGLNDVVNGKPTYKERPVGCNPSLKADTFVSVLLASWNLLSSRLCTAIHYLSKRGVLAS